MVLEKQAVNPVKKAEPLVPSGNFPSMLLQREGACGGTANVGGECSECWKKKLLQRRRANALDTDTAPMIVDEVLRASGQPLDAATRAFMEPRFGHDFGKVKVHT